MNTKVIIFLLAIVCVGAACNKNGTITSTVNATDEMRYDQYYTVIYNKASRDIHATALFTTAKGYAYLENGAETRLNGEAGRKVLNDSVPKYEWNINGELNDVTITLDKKDEPAIINYYTKAEIPDVDFAGVLPDSISASAGVTLEWQGTLLDNDTYAGDYVSMSIYDSVSNGLQLRSILQLGNNYKKIIVQKNHLSQVKSGYVYLEMNRIRRIKLKNTDGEREGEIRFEINTIKKVPLKK